MNDYEDLASFFSLFF